MPEPMTAIRKGGVVQLGKGSVFQMVGQATICLDQHLRNATVCGYMHPFSDDRRSFTIPDIMDAFNVPPPLTPPLRFPTLPFTATVAHIYVCTASPSETLT